LGTVAVVLALMKGVRGRGFGKLAFESKENRRGETWPEGWPGYRPPLKAKNFTI